MSQTPCAGEGSTSSAAPSRADFVPPARRVEALVQACVGDEVLIYDPTQHRAHALNGPAARVLQHCDGEQTVRAVAQLLVQAQLVPPEAELVQQENRVWLALLQLDRARLLQKRLKSATPLPTRRELLRQLVGVGLLPVVASIVSPTALETASCSSVSCVSKPCCTGKTCSGAPLYLCT